MITWLTTRPQWKPYASSCSITFAPVDVTLLKNSARASTTTVLPITSRINTCHFNLESISKLRNNGLRKLRCSNKPSAADCNLFFAYRLEDAIIAVTMVTLQLIAHSADQRESQSS